MTRIFWEPEPLPKPAKPPKRRRDIVTPELREAVLRRDGGCVAPRVCGCIASQGCKGRITLDHVKDQPRIGRRAPSDMAHLAAVCETHHLGTGWATAHRPDLRAYLRRVEAA